jgi:hypothetical protein
MNEKSLYIVDHLRKALEKGEVSEVLGTIIVFSKDILGYEKFSYHNGKDHVNESEIKELELKDSKVVEVQSKQIIIVTSSLCYHFFRSGEKGCDDSGLVVEARYTGPVPSFFQQLSQLIRGETDFYVDGLKCYGYGKEWEGEETQTPLCFKRYLGVRAPTLKQLSIEDIIRRHKPDFGEGVKIPIE